MKMSNFLHIGLGIKTFVIICCCMVLSSCETLSNIQNDERVNAIGSFELNPVHPNNYWYNGNSYEYNEYQIEITAMPGQARIQWDGKTIGKTPLLYSFSGVLDRDDRVVIRAIPVDEKLPAQEAVLKIRTELPRKIHFDLQKK